MSVERANVLNIKSVRFLLKVVGYLPHRISIKGSINIYIHINKPILFRKIKSIFVQLICTVNRKLYIYYIGLYTKDIYYIEGTLLVLYVRHFQNTQIPQTNVYRLHYQFSTVHDCISVSRAQSSQRKKNLYIIMDQLKFIQSKTIPYIVIPALKK